MAVKGWARALGPSKMASCLIARGQACKDRIQRTNQSQQNAFECIWRHFGRPCSGHLAATQNSQILLGFPSFHLLNVVSLLDKLWSAMASNLPVQTALGLGPERSVGVECFEALLRSWEANCRSFSPGGIWVQIGPLALLSPER